MQDLEEKKPPTYLFVSTEITLGQMLGPGPKKYPVGVPDGWGCVLRLLIHQNTLIQQICLIFTDMLTLNSGSDVQVW